MQESDAEIICHSPLFRGMDAVTVVELFKTVPFTSKSYTKGALIMLRGDRYDDLKILTLGEVSAEIQDFSGKTIKVENLKAPDALAMGILFATDNILPVTIVAQTDVQLLSIPKQSILKVAQSNQDFLLNYLTQSGNKVTFLVEKLRLFKFSSLKQKFCGYILNLSEKQNTDVVSLSYNREELAELFGVARPSLSRVCSELSELGWVALEGKRVTILNKSKLKAVLL